MLSISNVYGHGFDAQQVSRLEKLGFNIRPQVSRYMGAQLCRFIDFERGPCLELIQVEDDRVYMDFLPDGMRAYCPGISLVVPSTETIGDFKARARHLRPYSLHVNYDGSSEALRPGWNYLNFGIPVVKDTFIWLTAYDEPRPIREHLTQHPNRVTEIAGLVFDLESEDLKELRQLNRGSLSEGSFQIGGVSVWSKDVLSGVLDGQNKDFPLKAIVLRAENLNYFSSLKAHVQQVSFRLQLAIHIITIRTSWDLVIIQ